MFIKLQDLLDTYNWEPILKNSYNTLALSKVKHFKELTDDEATLIKTLITLRIGNLANFNTRYIKAEPLLLDFSRILTNNIFQLVTELRLNFKLWTETVKMGETHNALKFHPYNNDDDATNYTNTDTVASNELTSADGVLNLMLKNSYYLDNIYKNVKGLCFIMLEGV